MNWVYIDLERFKDVFEGFFQSGSSLRGGVKILSSKLKKLSFTLSIGVWGTLQYISISQKR